MPVAAAGPAANDTLRPIEGASRLLHVPVGVRSTSIAFLAVVAGLWAMQWAREVIVPILFGVMMSSSLTPLMLLLERCRVPKPLGAATLLLAIAVALSWGAWSLSDEVDALTDALPRITHEIRVLAESRKGTVSTIEKVQQAAAEIVAAAAPGSATPASAAATTTRKTGPQRSDSPQQAEPIAHGPQIDIRGYVLSGTLGAFVFLGQIAIAFCIAFFLLASGNNLRRKLVKLAGPRLAQKKVTIEALDEISAQIQRYLIVQLGVSVLIGLSTGLAFLAIGLNQPAVWGIVAALANLIPYVGALVIGVASAAFALGQFGTVEMVLLVGGVSFAIHTLAGNVLTPWWTGKASNMSPVAVFVAVLVFGWLWGVSGLLLGVPILMVIKAICDRIEDLRPIGEMLSE